MFEVIEGDGTVKINIRKRKRKDRRLLVCNGYPECVGKGAIDCIHMGLHFGNCPKGNCPEAVTIYNENGKVICEPIDSNIILRLKDSDYLYRTIYHIEDEFIR